MGRSTEFITLTPEGELIIRSGYAWDGPSGPTFDTPSSIRGSLVHDALYQLLRAELLPIDARDIADQELYRICVEDGMWKWRARLWLRAVRKCAAGAADPVHKKPLLVAPRPLEVDLTAFL
jgi:hypothetical protein